MAVSHVEFSTYPDCGFLCAAPLGGSRCRDLACGGGGHLRCRALFNYHGYPKPDLAGFTLASAPICSFQDISAEGKFGSRASGANRKKQASDQFACIMKITNLCIRHPGSSAWN